MYCAYCPLIACVSNICGHINALYGLNTHQLVFIISVNNVHHEILIHWNI